MLLDIRHETHYRYEGSASYVIQQIKLTPRDEAGQRILDWHIDVPARVREHTDGHGNVVHMLNMDHPTLGMTVRVEGRVETASEPAAMPQGTLHPSVYLGPTALTAASSDLRAFARAAYPHSGDPVDRTFRLMSAIHDHVAYKPGTTHAATSATDALEQGTGVCQDQAHLFVASCRALGIPARYVSGYLLSATDTHIASHAWADAWIEGLGWLGFDITHNRLANGEMCRLAVGRDYLEASPIRGVRRGGGAETMDVFVQVAMASNQ